MNINIEETPQKKDHVIGALIGLVMACESNDPTGDTIPLILEGLMASADADVYSPEELDDLVKRIQDCKYTIVPNCRTCASPCGNTSDYDMEQVKERTPQEQELIHDIRQQMYRIALRLDPDTASMEEALPLFEGLAGIRYAVDENDLQERLEELKAAFGTMPH